MRPLAVDLLDDADSNLGFFARGSLVAALVIVGVDVSARGGVAVLSSASIGGGQMYFVRVRGIIDPPDLVVWFYAESGVVVCCIPSVVHGRKSDQSGNKLAECT